MTENYNFNSIVIGTVLGDSSLIRGKTCKNLRIDFCHCQKQKEYFFWKVALLKQLGIQGSWSFYKGNINNYPKYRYSSHVDKRLTDLYSKLYKFRKTPNKRIKCITNRALWKLDECGLAIWFMDDGYNNNKQNYMHLSTYCFSKKDNEKIAKWLAERFNITNTKIYRRKDQYFLVWYEDAIKLKNIIKPTVSQVSCMKYKII